SCDEKLHPQPRLSQPLGPRDVPEVDLKGNRPSFRPCDLLAIREALISSFQHSQDHLPVPSHISQVKGDLVHQVRTGLVRKLLHISKLFNLTPLTQLAERNACNLCGPRVCTLPRTSFQILYHFFPFGMIRKEVIRHDESAAKVLHQLQGVHHRLLHFVNGSSIFVLHIGLRLLCHTTSLPSKEKPGRSFILRPGPYGGDWGDPAECPTAR